MHDEQRTTGGRPAKFVAKLFSQTHGMFSTKHRLTQNELPLPHRMFRFVS